MSKQSISSFWPFVMQTRFRSHLSQSGQTKSSAMSRFRLFSSQTVRLAGMAWVRLQFSQSFSIGGIGKALIANELDLLRSAGASGCVVLGDPNYYGPFGFKNRPECVFEGVPAEYFLSLTFGLHSALGEVTYHEAFSVKC